MEPNKLFTDFRNDVAGTGKLAIIQVGLKILVDLSFYRDKLKDESLSEDKKKMILSFCDTLKESNGMINKLDYLIDKSASQRLGMSIKIQQMERELAELKRENDYLKERIP